VRNQLLVETVEALRRLSEETGRPLWRALADELDKPKRRRVSVNLSRIQRHLGEGEVAAVPGKVLASGTLTKPVKVAAYAFSEAAREKILESGGEALGLLELASSDVEPSKIRIIK